MNLPKFYTWEFETLADVFKYYASIPEADFVKGRDVSDTERDVLTLLRVGYESISTRQLLMYATHRHKASLQAMDTLLKCYDLEKQGLYNPVEKKVMRIVEDILNMHFPKYVLDPRTVLTCIADFEWYKHTPPPDTGLDTLEWRFVYSNHPKYSVLSFLYMLGEHVKGFIDDKEVKHIMREVNEQATLLSYH